MRSFGVVSMGVHQALYKTAIGAFVVTARRGQRYNNARKKIKIVRSEKRQANIQNGPESIPKAGT